MVDWTTLGTEPTPDEDLEQLRAAASSLDDFLDGHPAAGNEILDILSRRFDGVLDTDTAASVYSSLAEYLGEDAGLVVAWVATGLTPASRIDALGEMLPEQVENVMRRVAAIYAPEFQEAWAIWNEMPNAWRNFYREVYLDVLNSRPHIRVRIERFNGETMMIEGTASSILQLATNMLITVSWVRNIAGPDAFRTDILQAFLSEADTVLEFLQPTEEKREEDAQPQSDSK